MNNLLCRINNDALYRINSSSEKRSSQPGGDHEEEWDDRRRQELLGDNVSVSSFKELNDCFGSIRNLYRIAYGVK